MSRARKHPRSSDDPSQRRLVIVGTARPEKAVRLIVQVLTRFGRLGATAKELAKETRLPRSTLYPHLRRLAEIGEVLRVGRGTYALSSTYHDLTADPTAIIGVQNVRFEVSNWEKQPTPPCRTGQPWRVQDGGSAGSFETRELAWEGRRIVLEWYPSSEKLIVKIAAVVPVPAARAGELKGYLDAMLGLGRGETTRVTQIEVNSDHHLLRVEPQYFEWRELGRWSHVIYQRAAALREEYRLAHPETGDGRPLPFEKAIELLVEGSPIARLERVLDKELELLRASSEREKKLGTNVGGGTEAAVQRRDSAAVSPGEAREGGFG